MTIRQARLTDESSVLACAEDAYEQYAPAIGKMPAPKVADFRHQNSEGFVHIAVSAHDEVDGVIVFFPRGDHMFLENVVVKESAAGKCVGRHLMAHCEAEARRLDLVSIQLNTNAKITKNLSMYPHLGYSKTGRRREDGFTRVYFEKTS